MRPYNALADVRQMISRSAYAQLRYSPLLLAAAVAGMALTFLLPPLLAIFATGLRAISWSRPLGSRWRCRSCRCCGFIGYRRLWGVALPAIALLYLVLYDKFRLPTFAAAAEASGRDAFTSTRRACHDRELRNFDPAKGRGDENFPVASWLIRKRHRPVILAFYEFVRTADDIADHPTLGSAEKLARLDRLEASLLGQRRRSRGLRRCMRC